jgi:hypothetical protein
MQQHQSERHLTEVEVAQRLGLTVKGLQDWRRRRVGPAFIKLGPGPHARVRYPLVALMQWETAQTVLTNPEVRRDS